MSEFFQAGATKTHPSKFQEVNTGIRRRLSRCFGDLAAPPSLDRKTEGAGAPRLVASNLGYKIINLDFGVKQKFGRKSQKMEHRGLRSHARVALKKSRLPVLQLTRHSRAIGHFRITSRRVSITGRAGFTFITRAANKLGDKSSHHTNSSHLSSRKISAENQIAQPHGFFRKQMNLTFHQLPVEHLLGRCPILCTLETIDKSFICTNVALEYFFDE